MNNWMEENRQMVKSEDLYCGKTYKLNCETGQWETVK